MAHLREVGVIGVCFRTEFQEISKTNYRNFDISTSGSICDHRRGPGRALRGQGRTLRSTHTTAGLSRGVLFCPSRGPVVYGPSQKRIIYPTRCNTCPPPNNGRWRGCFRWVGITTTVFNWATLIVVHALLEGMEVEGIDGPRCKFVFEMTSFKLKWIAQFINQVFQVRCRGRSSQERS